MESVIPLIKGFVLAILTIAISALLPGQLVVPYFALLLAFAAGIYVGFSLVDVDHSQETRWQIGFSLFCLLLALFGIWYSPLIIAAGWIAHGVWDLLHHLHRFKTATSKAYPLLCLSYDFAIAAYIFYWSAALI